MVGIIFRVAEVISPLTLAKPVLFLLYQSVDTVKYTCFLAKYIDVSFEYGTSVRKLKKWLQINQHWDAE